MREACVSTFLLIVLRLKHTIAVLMNAIYNNQVWISFWFYLPKSRIKFIFIKTIIEFTIGFVYMLEEHFNFLIFRWWLHQNFHRKIVNFSLPTLIIGAIAIKSNALIKSSFKRFLQSRYSNTKSANYHSFFPRYIFRFR